MWRAAIGAGLVLAVPQLVLIRPVQPAVIPTVSIWYRGVPDGVPRLDDLAALRALGFATVSWPKALGGGEAEVRRLASAVGLAVDVRDPSPPLTPETARHPSGPVDLGVDRLAAEDVPALAWRAVAHGARAIAFNPGSSPQPGWLTASGAPAPWLGSARELARQFTFNETLIEELRAGPPVTMPDHEPGGLDVTLLDTGRAWVIIATNTSGEAVRTEIALPPGVPPAPWSNLLDGSGMSMLSTPAGARWTLTLERGRAAVYAIDKTPSG